MEQQLEMVLNYLKVLKQHTNNLFILGKKSLKEYTFSGGLRHDPQRFMARNVNVAHFNPDMVAYTSPGSIYSESKHGNQNTAFFSEKC